MTTYVFAATAPPRIPVEQISWGRVKSTWLGHDGSRWELSDWRGGVFHTRAGLRGLHNPGWEPQAKPKRVGQRFQDYRTQPREVEWPLHLFSEAGSSGWAELDRAFWASLHPRKTGVWTVTSPNGASRALSLRLEDDGGHAYDRDPYYFGWVNYLVTLVADDPLWRGETVRRGWAQEPQLPFIPAEGAPPFNIASSKQIGDARVSNPGDEPAWPVWTVTAGEGPVSLEVTVAGGMFAIPSVPAGKTVVVDTDETNPVGHVGHMETDPNDDERQVFVPEKEISGELNPWDPRPIPPGSEVPIGFTMIGTGSVQVEFIPLYWRGIS